LARGKTRRDIAIADRLITGAAVSWPARCRLMATGRGINYSILNQLTLDLGPVEEQKRDTGTEKSIVDHPG
jgi:hypothetical protein